MDFKARIAVFGGRNISKEIYEDTVEIGKLLAKENYLVFCGGGEGVMEAICKGVNYKNGTSIGILKSDNVSEGNKYLTIPILTNMGITRNALLALNADVAIAISGNHGTLSEIAYALQLEVPVIGYKTWDIPGVISVNSINELISKVLENT
ncbi:MAG: TIGR00725 family protein [Candidatus Marinimicrobia bacterium]|nr:TIGR00725 family protein [Candidatus Neomarinimicrobiota bacterium]